MNAHLDHVKKETRFKQVQVMIQQIRKYWDPMSSLIIMGDFNDSPDSDVRKLIENEFSFLIDPWKRFNPIEESSHHGFKGKEENGARIDWILVPENLDVARCIMDKSHREGKFPSDHFPIICELKL